MKVFKAFTSRRGLRYRTPSEMDHALGEFATWLWLEGHLATEIQKTYAAICDELPHFPGRPAATCPASGELFRG